MDLLYTEQQTGVNGANGQRPASAPPTQVSPSHALLIVTIDRGLGWQRELQESGSFSRACTELIEQWRQSSEIEWTPQEVCLLRQHVTLRGTSLDSLKVRFSRSDWLFDQLLQELVASLGTKTIPQLMDYYWKHTKLWRLDPDEKEWL